jgi:hypothetical protein
MRGSARGRAQGVKASAVYRGQGMAPRTVAVRDAWHVAGG